MESLTLKALVEIAVVVLGIWLFLKFCAFAKRFALPGKVKLFTYLLTSLGVVFFNYLFSSAKTGMGTEVTLTNPKLMTTALIGSLVMVLLFSFALMAETRS